MRHRPLVLSVPIALIQDSWSLVRSAVAVLGSPPVAVWIAGGVGLGCCTVPLVAWLKCFDHPAIPFAGFLGASAAWLVGTNLSKKAALMQEYGEAERVWGHESQLMRLWHRHFPSNAEEKALAATQLEQEFQAHQFDPAALLEEATGIGLLGNSGSAKSCIAKLFAGSVGECAVLVLDPHDDLEQSNWSNLFVVRDYAAIAQQLELLLELLDNRDRTPLVIILEEWPAVRMYCKQQGLDIADRFLLRFGSEARKFNKLPIFCSQSGNIKALGMEGMGDFLENFLLIRLHRVALKYARNLQDRTTAASLKSVAYPCLVGDEAFVHPTHGHHERFYKGAPPRGLKPLHSLPLTIPLAVADDGEIEIADGWEPGSSGSRSGSSFGSPEPQVMKVEPEIEPLNRLRRKAEPITHEPEPVQQEERFKRLYQLRELRRSGFNKAECIERLWGIKKGGSSKYELASEMYEKMLKELLT